MITITEPLLPPEVDLKGFAYMPLQIERLLRSRTWIRAKANPALGFYSLNLWATSWHEGPPGSLQHDDITLADYARCTPVEWMKIRDEALATWALCEADDRLYHPVVCELALAAYLERLKYRKANAKRHGKAFKSNIDVATYQRRISDATAALRETAKTATSQIFKQAANLSNGKYNPASLLQGEGEGKKVETLFGETESESDRSRRNKNGRKAGDAPAALDIDFAEFWKSYPLKVKRPNALKAYRSARAKTEHAAIMAGLKRYTETKPDWQAWAHPASWLNAERWGDDALTDAADRPADYAAIRKRVEAEDEAKKLRGRK